MSADIIELHGPVPAGSHAVVHHLPCAIAHDGPAKVNTYFVPAMMPDDKGRCPRRYIRVAAPSMGTEVSMFRIESKRASRPMWAI